MKLYRIMLVDDEEEVRKGIINKIDWESNGFVVVGDAENGEDALEKTERLRPDVVMTDIKMPFMNGLELGERLSEIMPSTKIIIFSGSDDFEYAQKAIKINVLDYVLKPVNAVELVEVLQRLKLQLDREYDEKCNVENLRKHYIDSIPVIREQFLVGLIEGRIAPNQWKEQSKLSGINFQASAWAAALLHIDLPSGADTFEDISLQREAALIPISVKQIVDAEMTGYCNVTSFLYSDMVAVIASLDDKEHINELIQAANEMCKSTKRILGLEVSAGVGLACDNPADLRFSYRGAQSALDYRMVIGTGRSIYIGDVEPDTTVQLQFDEQEERELLGAIKMGGGEEITTVIQTMFKKFEDLLLPFHQYQIYMMEIMTSLLKVMQTYGLDIVKVFGERFDFYGYWESFHSLEAIRDWLAEICCKISESIRRERMDSSKMLAEKTKQYVAQNYQNSDLSVEMLCSILHVSPTYFSTIFKRETGMSFVNYLTTVRMEAAVNLLNTTDDKTYVIAANVGYAEPNYFSYVFKKQFGVSPSKYRSK